MKVLYIHQHFGTRADATGTRSYEFAKRLLAAGHSVTMICGSSEYNLSRASNGSKTSTFFIDGIKVLQANIPYSNKQGFLSRTFAFFRFAWRACVAARAEKDVDLVFATSTPLTVSIPGVLTAGYHKVPFVFEVRDLWPELPAAMGAIRNPFILWAMKKLELWSYKHASWIVALAPGIKKGIMSTGYPGNHISMIPNCSDTDLFKPMQPKGKNNELTLVFTGAHGKANGLRAVIDAAHQIKMRGETGVRFLLIGDGSEKGELLERASKLSLNNVTFQDPVPKTQLAQILQQAHVGLMILKNVAAFYEGTSPNKFFDYLAAGLAVLNNYPGWLACIIEQNRCGLVIPPDDPSAFADAVLYLRDHPDQLTEMATRSRQLAEREFGRDRQAGEFVHLLENVARPRVPGPERTTRLRPKPTPSPWAADTLPQAWSTAAPCFFATASATPLSPKKNPQRPFPPFSMRPRDLPAAVPNTRPAHLLKRILDVAGAGLALVPIGPVLAVTALLIRLSLGRPVLHTSDRPGLHGKIFRLYKFRTMTDKQGPEGQLLPDSQRLTPLGRTLRRLSLDELPQLWNVLKGDMSLVGPRPLLVEYLNRYTPAQARRHEVRPGITGWAQVHGRNAIAWEEKFDLDVWYVDHRSFSLDAKVLALTFLKVVKREGISQPGHATMEEFVPPIATHRDRLRLPETSLSS